MNPFLITAIKAAVEGGKEILKIYDTDFDVEVKDDNSPLTLADRNANEVINTFLQETGVPIISEENKQIAYSERKNWNRCWIVDPLDGTKEFVKRNGEFTVNIALVENGKPLLGVIFTPVTKELYYGEVGIGGFKSVLDMDFSLDNLEAKVVSLVPAHWEEPLKVVGSRSHMNEATSQYLNSLSETFATEIVSKGSSLKFCLVAEGKAHVYPRFAPTMEWDTAAGQAICESVGLAVIDQSSQEPMRYNKENLLNPFFLVRTL